MCTTYIDPRHIYYPQRLVYETSLPNIRPVWRYHNVVPYATLAYISITPVVYICAELQGVIIVCMCGFNCRAQGFTRITVTHICVLTKQNNGQLKTKQRQGHNSSVNKFVLQRRPQHNNRFGNIDYHSHPP